ncbi:cytidylyltransferase domain-containing protein [Legionella worsleiensis]|uniref:CMP-N-acetlyneuraminic acid synthetase n=1 Tax=Legionella worsleiensis TaxID=45076 RepID=A0A0W1A3P1_9GAMM|nr:acylneuraminate cytidylyltransferase family protein [Legionella worsleiensis]KTD75849.1 CMP-N-acetlyneuraminic acid synthetase [Legionella worsleiensis]STY32862.1 N-acylneuraminate cytidylyltransferase [Legionella worsleiensis]
MNVLAIIPARSGSKRLPGKNTRLLAGKPLIAHTIKAAIQSSCCDEIIVSTDSQEIADISKEHGATVPWLRPELLARDSSDVIGAVTDVLERYAQIDRYFDSVLLLQPTSPFRKAETIKKAVELHKDTGQSVVSINKVSFKPSWYRGIDNEGNLTRVEVLIDKKAIEEESPIYRLNGSIYIASTDHILTNKTFYSEPTKALLIDSPSESIDIDTSLDWALVEKLLELKEEVLV